MAESSSYYEIGEKMICPKCKQNTNQLYQAYTNKHQKLSLCADCCINHFMSCSFCKKHRKIVDVMHKQNTPYFSCSICHNSPTFVCPKCSKKGIRHSRRECSTCYYKRLARNIAIKQANTFQQRWTKRLYYQYVGYCINKYGGLKARLYADRHIKLFQQIDRDVCKKSELSYWLNTKLSIQQLRRHLTVKQFLMTRNLYHPLTGQKLKEQCNQQALARLLHHEKQQIFHEYAYFLSTQKKTTRTKLLYLRAAKQLLLYLQGIKTAVGTPIESYRNSLSVFISWLEKNHIPLSLLEQLLKKTNAPTQDLEQSLLNKFNLLYDTPHLPQQKNKTKHGDSS